jgi:hypothetical protein
MLTEVLMVPTITHSILPSAKPVPYARTVPSTNMTPTKSLPDSGLIFDALLRRDGFTPYPDGMSSLFFAFANLSLFNTDREVTINEASSYLDLSIL